MYKNENGNLIVYEGNNYEYHPENEIKAAKSPKVYIQKYFINNIEVEYENKLEISSSQEFSITYRYVNWGHENEFEHYVALVSNKSDTTFLKIGQIGLFTISDLTPNNYTLFINLRSRNNDIFSEPITFIVSPYWYNSWWFRAISAIVVFVVFVVLYKIKQRQNTLLEAKVNQQTEILKQEKIELENKATIIVKQNKEKDALIQEVHHRVKNNLQQINAMIKMQLNTISEEENRTYLNETSRRIYAMSLVHEMLYSTDNNDSITISEYIKELIEKLKEFVLNKEKPIKFELKIDKEVKFSISDSVAIGIITSEIVSNAIKYAFHDIDNPIIFFELRYDIKGNNIIYLIKDNGIGINENKIMKGLGSRLIDIFARQLYAEYEVKNGDGLHYIFKIPYKKNEK